MMAGAQGAVLVVQAVAPPCLSPADHPPGRMGTDVVFAVFHPFFVCGAAPREGRSPARAPPPPSVT